MSNRSRLTALHWVRCRLALLVSWLTHTQEYLPSLFPSFQAFLIYKTKYFCPILIVLSLLVSTAHAQVSTVLTPDSTLPTPSLVTPLDRIYSITKGTPVGPNLFHSFSSFDLASGDTANFVNSGGIQNILSRVTGNDPSNLFGTIQSVSTANMFFINPNGVVFGPDAQLNVNGSFHVSTADFLRLGDDFNSGLFSATDPASDVLISAPPTAFGFLSTNPSPIQVNESSLDVPSDHMLTIIGGNIEMMGGALSAQNGQIILTSLSSSGEVTFSQGQDTVTTAPELGDVTISDTSTVQTDGQGGGSIFIRGGELTLDASTLSANVSGPSNNGAEITPGKGIKIEMTDAVLIDNGSFVASNVFTDATADIGSGGVMITAPEVDIGNGSVIDSSVHANSGGGASGNISIDAGELVIHDFSFLLSLTESLADSGDIILNASEDLTIERGSFVFTNTEETGNAGDIDVQAGRVFLTGGDLPDFTGIASDANESPPFDVPTGNVGDIHVTANHLEIQNAEISTPTFSNGNAGNIAIMVTGDVVISGSDVPDKFRGIFTNTFGSGEGGDLRITANDLTLTNLASLQAATFDSGDAGDATITLMGNLVVEDGSFIQSRSAQNATGSAGDLAISAKDISVTGIGNATNFEISPEFTGISASTFNGPGGSVTIEAESLSIRDKAFVNTATFGPHPSGDITIRLSGDLKIDNGGQVFANTRSSGAGGKIIIEALEVALSGVNPVPSVTIDERTVIARSAITSRSQGGIGTGGDILVNAQLVDVRDGAAITTESVSSGSGGNIELIGNDSIMIDNSSVTTQSATSEGGNITFKAENLIQVTNSEITSRAQQGSANAGAIDIDPDFVVIQNSNILSTAVFGDGGPITISADSAILVDPFSTLDASSQFGGDGTVDIQAPIQQLSGAIAPLPEGIVKAGNLYAEACASQKGGQFSSLVKNTDSTVSPIPGGFLSSPLAFNVPDPSQLTTQAGVTSTDPNDLPPLQQWLGQMTWTIAEPNLSGTSIQTCSRKTVNRIS